MQQRGPHPDLEGVMLPWDTGGDEGQPWDAGLSLGEGDMDYLG